MMANDRDQGRKQRQQTYAIVRIDSFLGAEVPLERKVTVKSIVWTLERAEAEVARLNGLKEARDCYYFWQATRLERDYGDEAAVSSSSDEDAGQCAGERDEA